LPTFQAAIDLLFGLCFFLEERSVGKRLSKIYTRTGDDGTTGLGDGNRISKTAPRVEAMGQVDELNSMIGLLLTEPLPDEIRDCLTAVQHCLFDLGGELSLPGYVLVPSERAIGLERTLDALNDSLAPLEEFILPGGTRAAAICHLARTICRRAERALCLIDDGSPVGAGSRQYINRLSDLLFVMARSLNKSAGADDVLWKRDNAGTTSD
jgi:cob(I)alamin adenosyltransferase